MKLGYVVELGHPVASVDTIGAQKERRPQMALRCLHGDPRDPSTAMCGLTHYCVGALVAIATTLQCPPHLSACSRCGPASPKEEALVSVSLVRTQTLTQRCTPPPTSPSHVFPQRSKWWCRWEPMEPGCGAGGPGQGELSLPQPCIGAAALHWGRHPAPL